MLVVLGDSVKVKVKDSVFLSKLLIGRILSSVSKRDSIALCFKLLKLTLPSEQLNLSFFRMLYYGGIYEYIIYMSLGKTINISLCGF